MAAGPTVVVVVVVGESVADEVRVGVPNATKQRSDWQCASRSELARRIARLQSSHYAGTGCHFYSL